MKKQRDENQEARNQERSLCCHSNNDVMEIMNREMSRSEGRGTLRGKRDGRADQWAKTGKSQCAEIPWVLRDKKWYWNHVSYTITIYLT